METVHKLILAIFVLSALTGCTGSSEIKATPSPAKAGDGRPQPSGFDDPDKPSLFDDGGDDIGDDKPAGSTKIDYPVLTYFGIGDVSHEGRSLNMDIELATEIDDRKLQIESYRANVSCSGINGCEQREVDQKSRDLEGEDRYQRVSFDDRKKLGDDYEDSHYAIFADKVDTKKGRVFTFDKPLPVYPWPAAESRYEPLEKGRAEFETTVSASPPIGSVSQFEVRVRVKLESLSSSQAIIQIDTTIPSDNGHNLYGEFPIPRNTEYTIDIEERSIVEVDMTSNFKGEEGPERTQLRFRLCSSELESGTEEFSCR